MDAASVTGQARLHAEPGQTARQSEPIVEISHVNKWFGRNHVLRDVSTVVSLGEVIVVCGPSGSGKSTLLRCINGLERATSGDIRVVGLSVTERGADLNAVRRHVGMVFQQFNLFPHLDVVGNITLALRKVLGIPKSEAEDRAAALLTRVGLSDKARAFPQQLSGGQQQRVAIARALAMSPRVILFDEPTSALDPELIKEVLDVVRNLARDGVTMIVVTHEMGFAREAATRVLFMDAGTIVEDRSSQEFFASPREPRTRHFLETILGR